MSNLTKDEFSRHLQSFGSTLVFKKIPADVITPILASLKIFQHFPDHHFLLESAENGNNKGRFSVIGFMPDAVWKCTAGESFFNSDFAQKPQSFTKERGDVLENLRQFIQQSKKNIP